METGAGIVVNNNRDAYLSLSITVLAAFSRVLEIASFDDILFNIPLVLEIISTQSGLPDLEECYEFLYLVSAASETGIVKFCESRGHQDTSFSNVFSARW